MGREPLFLRLLSMGIRKGDSLSPLLFIMVIKSLSKMTSMLMLVEEGTLKRHKVSRDVNSMVMSQFANDTIFFLGASVENAHALKNFYIWLKWFPDSTSISPRRSCIKWGGW